MATTIYEYSILRDSRVECYSVMTSMTIRDYLKIAESTYENRGGIEGQREPLKTNTAIRIRRTMISDLQAGAVLPPVVLGLVIPAEVFGTVDTFDAETFTQMLEQVPEENVSIIDGMQRTTAMLEMSSAVPEALDRRMRVEYWVATNTNSLIYRMLVLNTGQVPWNIRRQIEVVFQAMVREIKKRVTSIEIMEVNDARRRIRGGQFQANLLVELFLVFGARKEKVDTKERLADEFTRLDFIEATSRSDFTETFYEVIRFLGALDKSFDRYKPEHESGRFKTGKDLFSSQPACVGLVTACAVKLMGRPGSAEVPDHEKRERLKSLSGKATDLLQRLDLMTAEQIGEFLDYTTLNEVLSDRKTGAVGDFEREFFLKAFQVLIEEEFTLMNMTPCWRAY